MSNFDLVRYIEFSILAMHIFSRSSQLEELNVVARPLFVSLFYQSSNFAPPVDWNEKKFALVK